MDTPFDRDKLLAAIQADPARCGEVLLPALSQASDRSDFLFLADLAEKAGELEVAVSAYNRLLERDENDRDALWALYQLRLEQGRRDRARRLLEKLAALGDDRAGSLLTGSEEEADTTPSEPEEASLSYTDADLMLFCDYFAGRAGVHARQWKAPDGRYGYAPVMAPLTPALVRQHLLGACTLGVYPLDHADRVKFLALDIDLSTPPEQFSARQLEETKGAAFSLARRLADEMVAAGFEPLLEDSGYKGFHVWLLFEEFWPAARARRLARHFAAAGAEGTGEFHIDIFPAQERVKKGGLGNLIKLPLGIHLKSGRRSRFVDREGKEISLPFQHIRRLKRAGAESLEQALAAYETAWKIKEKPDAGRENHVPTKAEEPLPAPAACVPLDPPYDPQQDEELQFLLERCATLQRLVQRAGQGGKLTHDEQAVLRHTLGHLSRGPDAVNYLFDKAGCLDESSRLVSRLRGNPASCPRIRARLKLEKKEPCACEFSSTLGHYPTPLLHLAALLAEKKVVALYPPENAPELLSEYRRVLAEKERLERLAAELEKKGVFPGPQQVVPDSDKRGR